MAYFSFVGDTLFFDIRGWINLESTVLKHLQNKGIFINATCGGAGTCGKCTVYVDGVPCLACQTSYKGQKIDASNQQDSKQSEDDFVVLAASPSSGYSNTGKNFGLAVDIGTTTIAFALVDLASGNIVNSFGMVNSQRTFGADVISRIKAADEGKLDLLNKFVVEDILKGIAYICKDSKAVRKMVVAGNTTMLHILLGESCHSLGQYPFTPVFIDMQRRPFDEIFGCGLLDLEVVLLPGISTYVGADVVAGVFYGESLGKHKNCLLVDLGTNGELALFSNDTILATATAAGPAFEAGNIFCGTGSIPGAICKYNDLGYETINNCEPIGLCGSGVLDVAAFLVLKGVIDEAGGMDDDFIVADAPEGAVVFTPKDVRELQLAKSALRAGVEVLLAESGKNHEDIDMVYLAGGFGHTLNLESALVLGILPETWRDRVLAIGNSSLAGCVRFLTDQAGLGFAADLKSRAKEINLSDHPRFNDLFMEYMMFEN